VVLIDNLREPPELLVFRWLEKAVSIRVEPPELDSGYISMICTGPISHQASRRVQFGPPKAAIAI
jgi:hypothetical protein